MNHKLIVDSCCDLTDTLKNAPDVEQVPLSIAVDGACYIDGPSLNLPLFMEALKKSRTAPKSACPAPYLYAEAFQNAENAFVVTLSAKLSGSYESAMAALRLIQETGSDCRIHVFDSCSAAAGELAVALKIRECLARALPFEETVRLVEDYIAGMHTFFILENLDTLIKAGRMSRITGYVASAMSMRPIMAAENGEIRLHEKIRGSVRAFTRLAEVIGEACPHPEERTLAITHCGNEPRARFIATEARRMGFREVVVAHTGGISSLYANEGGVVVAF